MYIFTFFIYSSKIIKNNYVAIFIYFMLFWLQYILNFISLISTKVNSQILWIFLDFFKNKIVSGFVFCLASDNKVISTALALLDNHGHKFGISKCIFFFHMFATRYLLHFPFKNISVISDFLKWTTFTSMVSSVFILLSYLMWLWN